MNRLNIYKTHPDITLPKFATRQSACFDISFQPAGKYEYSGINQNNAPFTRQFHNGSFRIMPGDRILVPTGMIFDIPEGYSVRIHPRSGLSYKQGLVLANLEAVIDSDYIQETFVLLHNTSQVDQTIYTGDRIAQGEMVKKEEYTLWQIDSAPVQKTDRTGGLGSTGIITEVFSSEHRGTGGTLVTELPKGETLVISEDIKYFEQKLAEQAPVKRGRGRPKKNLTPAQ